MIYSSTNEAMPHRQGGKREDGKRSRRADHSHGGVQKVARSKQKILILDALIHFKFLRDCLLKNLSNHNLVSLQNEVAGHCLG